MADDDQKLGLNAALDGVEIGSPEGTEFKRAEQLSLMPSEAVKADIVEGTEERAGPGRPRGSKNKRTQDWTDYLLGRYPSPLIFLAEAYSRPVEDLAKELSCKKEDAMKIQVAAAKEVAPYVHQKQPVAVEVSQSGVVQLVLETSSELADQVANAGQSGDGAVVIEGEIVENGGENEN